MDATLEDFISVITGFLTTRAEVAVDRVPADFNLLESGLVDSVAIMELFFLLQDRFDGQFLRGAFELSEVSTPAGLHQRYLSRRALGALAT